MPARPILNPNERPVVRDDKETLWQLAQIVTSKDVTLNDQLEIAPPSREAHSPVQSRRGVEREELSRTWRWPRPPSPPNPSLPSSTRMLPYETQRWSTVQPSFPPNPPNPPAPPNPPPNPPRRALAPIDPNIATLANELRTLERENAALKKYVVRQKKALVAVARLHEPPL